MKKHWKFIDWLMLLFEIALPTIAILCAIFIQVENYSTDAKLATIVAGIVGQVVLIGYQLKQISSDVQNNGKRIDSVEKSVCYTNEMATILAGGEERRIDFAKRRLLEVEEIFKTVSKEKDSGRLSVSTYYKELDYLKDLLLTNIRGSKIWAMTGFSDTEWDDSNNDLEKAWCDTLEDLAQKVITQRVCIISLSLDKKLRESEEYFETQLKDWKENERRPELIKEKSLKSFFDYISKYYGKESKRYKVDSYHLSETSQKYNMLTNEKGFFGIELSGGKRLLIKGEAVNPSTGLQGSYVFDESVITQLFDLHQDVCSSHETLETFLNGESYSSFLSFCKKQGLFGGVK